MERKNIDEANNDQIGGAPVGRQGTGEDIARVISFLVDDHSDFITGSIIPVTGGMDVLSKSIRSWD